MKKIVSYQNANELKLQMVEKSLYHLIDTYVSNLKPSNVNESELEKLKSYINRDICILSFLTGAINTKLKDYKLIETIKEHPHTFDYGKGMTIEVKVVNDAPYISISDKLRTSLKHIESIFKRLNIKTERERHTLFRHLTEGRPIKNEPEDFLRRYISEDGIIKDSETISYVYNFLKDDFANIISTKPFVLLKELKQNTDKRNRLESEYYSSNKRIKTRIKQMNYILQSNKDNKGFERRKLEVLTVIEKIFECKCVFLPDKIKLEVDESIKKDSYKRGRIDSYANRLVLLIILFLINNKKDVVFLLDLGKILNEEDKSKFKELLKLISENSDFEIHYNFI